MSFLSLREGVDFKEYWYGEFLEDFWTAPNEFWVFSFIPYQLDTLSGKVMSTSMNFLELSIYFVTLIFLQKDSS